MTVNLVQTNYGAVKGAELNGVSVWKGIPYAQPPVANLRFRVPQKLAAWEGVFEATQFGHAAIQPPSEVMRFLGSDIKKEETNEDCLTLNIWSPKADNKLRPVMVWIHGGAFLNGAGATPTYDGTSFALESDVVVVTINYRLGVLGFLHLGDLGDEEFAGAGNCGILDQVAALEWVKENIEAFGGNPDNITLFGESAGAMSIGVLLGIPAAKGLFHKAILQSGAARNVLQPTIANHVTNGILANLGISTDALYKLREISTDQLIEASKNTPPMALGPVVDGFVIPEHPEVAISKGASKHIPLLIGTNKDEFQLYTIFDSSLEGLTDEEIELRLKQTLGYKWDQIASNFKEIQMDKDFYTKVLSFNMFTAPAIWLAEKQSEQGAPVWMYRFDWETPVLNGGLKACHALELPFVWNKMGDGAEALLGKTPDKSLANSMHLAWGAFAKCGNPTIAELPHWPAYDVASRETMIFNKHCTVVIDPDNDTRVIWESASFSAN